jgi:hypothetical protein
MLSGPVATPLTTEIPPELFTADPFLFLVVASVDGKISAIFLITSKK